MKAVQLLVNSYLPEDMRNYGNKYDTKDINKILVAVARKHPEKYAEVEKKLSDIGRTASYLQGATISLKDLEPVIDKKTLFADMDKEIAALPKDEHFTERRREIFNKYRNTAGKLVAERALKNRNNIAMAVLSGARGKNDQLAAMIFSPFQYSDYKGEPVDVISRSSFAEGINPTVFLASTNGSRASVVSAKCLAHDTLVRMADLSERKICDIKPGEQVLGADREGHVFPVKVLNVFYQGEKECFVYRFDCIDRDATIIATEDHKMLTERSVEPLSVVEKEEVPVLALEGCKATLTSKEEAGMIHFYDIEGCKGTLMSKKAVGMIHCFDIEVDHPDHLFVLANGLITSNSSTAKGGDIAKQFAASTADLTIRQEDCHTSNGIALSIDDKSLKGRALAQDVGGYKAGSFINADMLADLRKKGVKNVVARSALTCRADGGLCAHCVGKFFHGGKLPKVGDSVGLMASTSISEPVTQMALCLAEDTMVRMADGSAKKIKDIAPGDAVAGAGKDASLFPAQVLTLFDQGEKDCFTYTFAVGDDEMEITATEDHKMLAEGAVLPLRDIEKGNIAVADLLGRKATLKGKKEAGRVHCFDIEVDHPDHLFVLANGLITSNSAKHSAGMTKDKKSYSGIPALQQFTQSPEKYKDRAVVSELDGVVDAIEPADQGGTYITVSGKKHYIQPGHDPEVKVGDKVEAGDFLSEGLPDIEDTVRLKGLGAGRKLYATRLNQLLSDSGVKADPRNTEIIARGALRHVVVKGADGFGDYEPDDVIDYEVAEQSYKMPDTTQAMKPTAAVGKYLQAPFLHYTVGTRITPNVAKDLESNGYNTVYADTKTPEFEPEMVRLRTASHTTRDWLASLGTSYLTKQLQDSATRGDDTNILHNKDYRPRLAYGVGFGQNIEETGEF